MATIKTHEPASVIELDAPGGEEFSSLALSGDGKKSLVTLVLRQRLERRNFRGQLADMVEACLQSGIEEVLLYPHGVGAYDSSTGFWNDCEMELDLALLAEAKDLLEQNDIRMGMNIWQTIGHSDRGRQMLGYFDFQPLVSAAGDETTSQACPLCEKWRGYYFGCLRRYAELRPSRFYFDDDFRYQNHGNARGTGSFYCFCPLHLADFNQRNGTSYDREGLIGDIVRKGKPHPARAWWLETLNAQLIELAAACEEVIHDVSPETEIGLMSSHADMMLQEGRDWERLLSAVAGRGRPLLYRPAYPDYLEFGPREHTHALSIYRQIFAELPQRVVAFAEIDNCVPTEFNQSPAHLCLRMLLAALAGARGFHLSIFGWNGNPDTFSGHHEYPEKFHRLRESLDTVLDGLEGAPVAHGIELPCNRKRVLGKETAAGKDLSELAVNSLWWAKPLQLAGLPVSFEKSWAAAVTEDVLWGLDRPEIEDLLSRTVLLDYTAMRWLFASGYGDLIGLAHVDELPPGITEVVIEEIVDPADPFCGARFDYSPLAALSPEFRLTLKAGALCVTRFLGREEKDLGPGAFSYQNALGGTILGIPLLPQALEYNPFQIRYRIAGLTDRLLLSACAQKASYFDVKGQPNVLPLHIQYGPRHLLACANLRTQSADKLVFRTSMLPARWRGCLWQEMQCLPLEWEAVEGDLPGTQAIRILSQVPPQAVVILISEK